MNFQHTDSISFVLTACLTDQPWILVLFLYFSGEKWFLFIKRRKLDELIIVKVIAVKLENNK